MSYLVRALDMARTWSLAASDAGLQERRARAGDSERSHCAMRKRVHSCEEAVESENRSRQGRRPAGTTKAPRTAKAAEGLRGDPARGRVRAARQALFAFKTWGGARRGAGRKPAGK